MKIQTNDVGLSAYIEIEGKNTGLAQFIGMSGRWSEFESELDLGEWNDRYYSSDFYLFNQACFKYIKLIK